MDLKAADNILIQEALSGNQSAYTLLLDKYKYAVYAVALKIVKNKEDAEDVVMETFNKAFNHLSTYNNEYAFATWLFKIATNTAIDLLRKNNIQKLSIDDNELHLEEKYSDNNNAEFELIKKQDKNYVLKIIQQLENPYRDMIFYRYFDELSYGEIAEKTNTSLANVKIILHRAKKQLQKIILHSDFSNQ